MRVLGISAFYHDSAAALVRDGEIIAAAQEERFTRKKHDSGFPTHAVEYCLAQDGVSLDEVDYVVFYDKPFLKFERLLETYRGLRAQRSAFVPNGHSAVDPGKALSKEPASSGSGAVWSQVRLGEEASFHRTSPEPRGQRLLSRLRLTKP